MKGHRFLFATIVTVGLGFFSAVHSDPPGQANQPHAVRFIEFPGEMEFSGEMIARPWSTRHWLERGLDPAAAQENYEEAVRVLAGRFEILRHRHQTDQYIISIPAEVGETEAADQLLATGLFKFVEPNWRVYPTECPDDSRFGEQWHHDASHFDSCAAWEYGTGEPGTSVGVCDTGIRYTHEDLQLHRLEGYNAVDERWESEGGEIEDIYGHGTEATGCAAANGNNGVGVSGMGWDLSHRMLRVTNDSGGGSSIDILNHAAMVAIENGSKVASLSYHGVDNESVLETATYIKSIGGLMIWAAGNQYRRMTYGDRDADDVIAVGAVDRFENLMSWSNYGPFVDFVAYGNEVRTVSSGGDREYRDFAGTSAACPLASGTAAMIWSVNPDLTPDEVEEILKSTCVDLGDSGTDDTFGYGRIFLREALAAASGGDQPMELLIDDLVAGQQNTVAAQNCDPAYRAYFIYSLRGLGSYYVPQLDVTLDLDNPALGTWAMPNSEGYAEATGFVPSAVRGRHIWIQGAQYRRVSDVWDGDIQ